MFPRPMAKQSPSSSAHEPKAIVNRKARYDYELLDSWEAGIALVGSEVKSIWKGRVNMTDAFVRILNGEAFLMNLDIEEYDLGSAFNPARRRDRKLLLNRREINTIDRKSMEKGFTIVPTKIYFKNGRVKVEIAIGRGKKHYDKRDQIAKDDTRREVDRLRNQKF